MKRWAGLLLACFGALPVGAAEPAKKTPTTPPAADTVTLVCEALYLPTRATWARTVRVAYDQQRIREVVIDGQVVNSFSIQNTLILTSQDNERIQIDVAAQTWRSDFRGLATAEGRCERV